MKKLTVKQKRIALALGVVAFYFFCLLVFIRLTFPYDTLRDRVLAEFNGSQKERVLRVAELSGSGIFGVELEGVELTEVLPPGQAGPAPAMKVESLDLSVSLLSYLFGAVSVDFDAEVGGGEIEGDFYQSDAESEINLEFDAVDISELTLLSKSVGLPMGGTLKGTVELSLPEGQMTKAVGKLDLGIDALTVGDGKAKIRNALALPKISAGNLALKAEATDGRLDVTEFGCDGKDFEMNGSGRIRLRQPFDKSITDLDMAFRFKEAYRTQSDLTKSLFGSPDSKVPALFDMDPMVRRAKGEDGFYRWRVTGLLSNPSFRPGRSSGSRKGKDDDGEPG